MSMPTYEQAMIPVLRSLSSGTPRSRRDIVAEVATSLALSPEERALMLPSGKTPVIRSRVGWAITYLRQAALLRWVKRGVYEITDRGRHDLATHPDGIDSD